MFWAKSSKNQVDFAQKVCMIYGIRENQPTTQHLYQGDWPTPCLLAYNDYHRGFGQGDVFGDDSKRGDIG